MTNLILDLRCTALLLKQGQTLPQAFQTISQRSGSQAWAATAEALLAGGRLEEALPPLPVQARVLLHQDWGEQLPQAFQLAAQLLEEGHERRLLWRSMLIYPLVLLVAGLGNLLFVSWLAVESQKAFFIDTSSLSIVSAFVINASRAVVNYTPALLLALLVVSVLISQSAWRARLPVVSTIFQLRESVAWLRWLDALLGRNLPLPRAVELAARCCVGPLGHQLQDLVPHLESGSSLARAMEKASLLPRCTRWLVAQAEERSFAPGCLKGAAATLEETLEFHLAFGSVVAQITVILFVGAIALWSLWAVIEPLYVVGNLV